MNPKHPDLTINTDLARQILTGFIHSEVTRTGFTKAVIGLSGGIDSALSCFLAAEALGPANVLAVRMPYKSSSQDSLDHAQQVIDKLGVASLTIPITPMVQPYLDANEGISSFRAGNIMARQRMIVLYDQSAVFGGLVIGTSNKTEILLGYSTLWGDSASALNPIGDLYKTQIRQLSRAMGVPEAIVAKPPTADLWLGQTDEKELGFTYADVDPLLYLLVDERYTPQECVDAGYEEGFVNKVVDRIRRNQFKRILPPIAKLGQRTIGYDFLYLRDWGT
ncbi:NAD+ synthase [Leptolinea tardivitalis]|uniref:NH(3)-dependent NAD(+) synthetase n=1 Tax=Leptolinea tardivitalis TaxID=229920 RepID=A0A0P6XHV4_9CHLR|nr:NAD+ synthase [Leptolinea tardivitalis]KPL75060.1 NAD synthetase [Leptolinea tardivitalis]GAP20479.1 NH(3)-dependent NAD(+) synthetase [Leptolinea tardivitalis]